MEKFCGEFRPAFKKYIAKIICIPIILLAADNRKDYNELGRCIPVPGPDGKQKWQMAAESGGTDGTDRADGRDRDAEAGYAKEERS